jgi:hypothetical protein
MSSGFRSGAVNILAGFGIVSGIALLAAGTRAQGFDHLPPGWHRMGPRDTYWDHTLKLDTKTMRSGASSLRIESVNPGVRTLAGVVQAFDPGPYRGTRVRLRGYARVSNLSGWAGLLMRVSSPSTTAFDNMSAKPYRGTADWTAADVVLDVPADAVAIYVGAVVVGSGRVWLDDFQLDSVPRSVATTGPTVPLDEPPRDTLDLPPTPTNLGFEPRK